MPTLNSKITLHMVASLDGFIAKKDGSVDWMQTNDHYEKGVELTEEAMEAFNQKIDCYVMGVRTYAHALELGWPYGGKPVKVLASNALASTKPTVEFYSGELAQLVNQQLKPSYRNIWVVGGSQTIRSFLENDLADDLIVTILPILLGEGILFFDSIGREQPLHLKDVTAYKDGMVELWYALQ